MERIALGEMNMTEAELESITLRSFFNKLTGFRLSQRDDWERTRAQTFLMLGPYFEKSSKATPQEVFPLPWDRDVNTLARPDPKALAEQRKKMWAEIDARKKKNR